MRVRPPCAPLRGALRRLMRTARAAAIVSRTRSSTHSGWNITWSQVNRSGRQPAETS